VGRKLQQGEPLSPRCGSIAEPNLVHRLDELDDSLGEFQASDPTPWEIALIFNALLEELKGENGDDPVLRSIGPLAQSSESSLAVVRKLMPLSPGPYATANIGAVRTAVKQILVVAERAGANTARPPDRDVRRWLPGND
jgi:hypothetical protein